MPLISIDDVHPTKEQKEQLIAGLTKTASEILCAARLLSWENLPLLKTYKKL